MLSPEQIRAARALVGWKQEDLADASGMSLTAIRSLEMGYRPRHSTMDAVRTAFEDAGLEFIDGDGVRRRNDAVKIYESKDNCDRFFDEVAATAKKDGGSVLVSIKSPSVLTHPCGSMRQTNLERLELLRDSVPVQCLLSETIPPQLFATSLEMRPAPANSLGVASCFIYGNKYAEIVQEARHNFLIVVFSIAAVAHDYRKQFLSEWSAPLQASTRHPQERRLGAAV